VEVSLREKGIPGQDRVGGGGGGFVYVKKGLWGVSSVHTNHR
jgi:hypothetical protein